MAPALDPSSPAASAPPAPRTPLLHARLLGRRALRALSASVQARRRAIPAAEIEFLGFTTLDDVGRPFLWRGEVYRGIYPHQVAWVRELFASGLVAALVDAGLLVETEPTELVAGGFGWVLRHRRLTPARPTEWTASMLRDAALAILETERLCNRFGFTLRDAHPYNVCFDRSRPRWVDLGSIGRRQEGWPARAEFVNETAVPLAFLARGEQLEGYAILMAARSLKIAKKEFRRTILFERFLALAGETPASFSDERIDAQWIARTCASAPALQTSWGAYQEGDASVLADLAPHPGNRFGRFFQLAELVARHAPEARTCLDLAGNVGLASAIVAARNPSLRCVNTDNDPVAIEKSYALLRREPRLGFESYLLNFMLPMYPDAPRVFRSDVAMALAVTHHLLLAQGHKLSEVLERIGGYARRLVLVEFMPLGLWGGDPERKPPVPAWYTTPWFEQGFRRQFDLVERRVLESHRIAGVDEPHRVLFVGRVR